MAPLEKQFTIAELKTEWKKLWQERRNDKVRAEGIAVNDYCSLFIEKGTIIHATRDFKALSFKEILQRHEVPNVERYISLDPNVGGWHKFVKDNIFDQKTRKETFKLEVLNKNEIVQRRKSGRGWLHQ